MPIERSPNTEASGYEGYNLRNRGRPLERDWKQTGAVPKVPPSDVKTAADIEAQFQSNPMATPIRPSAERRRYSLSMLESFTAAQPATSAPPNNSIHSPLGVSGGRQYTAQPIYDHEKGAVGYTFKKRSPPRQEEETNHDDQVNLSRRLSINTHSNNISHIVDQVLEKMQLLGMANDPNNQSNASIRAVRARPNIDEYLQEVKISSRLPVFNDDGTLHPIDFVNQVEQEFRVLGMSFENFQYTLSEKFGNKARVWSQALLFSFRSFQDFKTAFVQHFWSETKQLDIKLELQATKYTEREGSLVNHFMKYIAMARHIDPPYSESMLIATIARHYPPNVSSVLIGACNIEQALERLRQADRYFRRDESSFLNNVYGNCREERINFREAPQKNSDSDRERWFKGNMSRNSKPKISVITAEVSGEEGGDIKSGNEMDSHN